MIFRSELQLQELSMVLSKWHFIKGLYFNAILIALGNEW